MRSSYAKARRLDRSQTGRNDRLDEEIKRYPHEPRLPDSLTDEEHRRLEAILTFAFNLESAGDVIERDIMAIATKLSKRVVDTPPEDQREIETTLDAAAPTCAPPHPCS